MKWSLKTSPKRIWRHTLWLGLLSSLVLTKCSCDFFGTTGALLISEQDEMQLGAEFDKQLRDSVKSYPIYVPKTKADTAFQAYVFNLCQSVLDKIPADEKPEYKFKFTLIDQNVQNAFAVPGGYVYIYTGILKSMQDESELVGVIGHEIAHVTRHHYRSSLAKQAGLSLLVSALIDDNSGEITKLVAASFVGLTALSISRGHESDADTYGTLYTGNVERNPLGIASFFSRLKSDGFEWLSTHPGSDNRVEAVSNQVNKDAKLKALANEENKFKSRFQEMVAVLKK